MPIYFTCYIMRLHICAAHLIMVLHVPLTNNILIVFHSLTGEQSQKEGKKGVPSKKQKPNSSENFENIGKKRKKKRKYEEDESDNDSLSDLYPSKLRCFKLKQNFHFIK